MPHLQRTFLPYVLGCGISWNHYSLVHFPHSQDTGEDKERGAFVIDLPHPADTGDWWIESTHSWKPFPAHYLHLYWVCCSEKIKKSMYLVAKNGAWSLLWPLCYDISVRKSVSWANSSSSRACLSCLVGVHVVLLQIHMAELYPWANSSSSFFHFFVPTKRVNVISWGLIQYLSTCLPIQPTSRIKFMDYVHGSTVLGNDFHCELFKYGKGKYFLKYSYSKPQVNSNLLKIQMRINSQTMEKMYSQGGIRRQPYIHAVVQSLL